MSGSQFNATHSDGGMLRDQIGTLILFSPGQPVVFAEHERYWRQTALEYACAFLMFSGRAILINPDKSFATCDVKSQCACEIHRYGALNENRKLPLLFITKSGEKQRF